MRIEFVFSFLLSLYSFFLFSQDTNIKVNEKAAIKVYEKTIEFENYEDFILPDSLHKYQQVEVIFFYRGGTSDPNMLFNSLARFNHLKELYFQNYNLKIIPNNIEKLEKLETLRISNDSLYKISHKIKNSRISSLIINNAKVGTLPLNKQKQLFKRISLVKSLQCLDLANNGLDTLFNCISNTNINHLGIEKNKFHRFPAVIVSMMNNKALRQIDIDFTDDLLFSKTELDKVVKRERVYYEICLYFDKKVTNNYMHDIINKISQKYPVINSFGAFRK